MRCAEQSTVASRRCDESAVLPPAAHVSTFIESRNLARGPGSVEGIASAFGLDGPGIESRWGRDFPHLSRSALRPIQPPV